MICRIELRIEFLAEWRDDGRGMLSALDTGETSSSKSTGLNPRPLLRAVAARASSWPCVCRLFCDFMNELRSSPTAW